MPPPHERNASPQDEHEVLRKMRRLIPEMHPVFYNDGLNELGMPDDYLNMFGSIYTTMEMWAHTRDDEKENMIMVMMSLSAAKTYKEYIIDKTKEHLKIPHDDFLDENLEDKMFAALLPTDTETIAKLNTHIKTLRSLGYLIQSLENDDYIPKNKLVRETMEEFFAAYQIVKGTEKTDDLIEEFNSPTTVFTRPIW